MRYLLISLAWALVLGTVNAADFQAVTTGEWHDTNTWGVTSWPGGSDNVDLNGQTVTMTGTVSCASLVDTQCGWETGGALDFGAGASFTCRAVTNAELTTSAADVVVDCDYTLTIDIDGFLISPGGIVTIAGAWNNSSVVGDLIENCGTVTDFSGSLVTSSPDGRGASNGGTWIDFSGSLVNIGIGYGAINSANWVDFSGSITNIGGGIGAYNGFGTWTDFSGSIVNSSGSGAKNLGYWTDFSGLIINTGDGFDSLGVWNEGEWTDFSGLVRNTGSGYGIIAGLYWYITSGEVYDSGTGCAIYGSVQNITGIVGRPSSQLDLAAENIRQGKTILGTTGTLATKPGFGGGAFTQ